MAQVSGAAPAKLRDVQGCDSERDVTKILGGNLLRVMEQTALRRGPRSRVDSWSRHGGTAIVNPGVPIWPEFCLTYGVTSAAFLAWLLRSGRVRAATL